MSKVYTYIVKELQYIKTVVKRLFVFKRIVTPLIIFSVIAAITDGIGIGLILPFLQGFQSEKHFFLFEKLKINFASKNEELIVLLILIVSFVILKTVFTMIFLFFSNKLQLKMLNHLREQVMKKIFSYKFIFFTKENCGRLVNVFMTQTMEYMAAVNEITKIFSNALILVVMFTLMLVVYFKLTVFTLVFFLIILICIQLLGKKIHYFQRQSLQAGEKINALFMDDILGISIIKTFAMEERRLSEHISENNTLYRSAIRHRMRTASIQPILEMVFVSMIAGLLLFGMLAAKNDWIKHLAYFLGFFVLLERTRRSFNPFSTGFANLARFKQSVFNVNSIFETKDVEEDKGNIEIPKFVSQIEFEDLSMSYDDKKKILKRINMVIHKGETVAIVGRSGSGKTTLANLLLKLFKPTQGKIIVDGIELSKIKNSSWYDRIGVVFQDSFIFNNTIAWNITRGDNTIDLKTIKKAAKIAKIDTFISKLPNGYNTFVGDRGIKLSGGQRQRIAIARSVVKKPEILIFDEATSSLDSINEKMITEALENIRKNTTMIIIAHRLSTIKKADKIVVFKDGKIVGYGKHNELLNSNKEYALLYKTQFAV